MNTENQNTARDPEFNTQSESVEPGFNFTVNDEELFVRPKCGIPRDDGTWLCATHAALLHNAGDLAVHLKASGDHTILWNCPEHGPEAP